MGEVSSKIFLNLPPHWSLSVRFDVIMTNILNWNDREYFAIFLDQLRYDSFTYSGSHG